MSFSASDMASPEIMVFACTKIYFGQMLKGTTLKIESSVRGIHYRLMLLILRHLSFLKAT
jgi:hypothetical protein